MKTSTVKEMLQYLKYLYYYRLLILSVGFSDIKRNIPSKRFRVLEHSVNYRGIIIRVNLILQHIHKLPNFDFEKNSPLFAHIS